MSSAAVEAIHLTEIGHRYIPIGSIEPSKTNPRTHFDQGKLDELAESILRHGILQPIVVRPRDKVGGEERVEIVCGERRYRAALQIAFAEVPCVVRDLSDKEALEIQLVENMQRADLHPLEEAEGYVRLLREHGYDADSLAAKIGKSRSYIYGRMKLADLCASAKKALWEEKISHSVALLIARIPDAKLQAEALKMLAQREHSYREAVDLIQRHFMLRLADAPFDRTDMQLVPAAGPCTTCPMRTGNQSELFADVKSADVCTNPSCYQTKAAAHLKAEAKAKGWKSLTADQSKKLFRDGSLPYGAGYVEIGAAAYELGSYNKKYSEVVPKDTTIYLASDDRGQVHKLFLKRDLPKRKQRASSSSSQPRENKKWKRQRELGDAVNTAIAAAVAKKVNRNTKAGELFPAVAQAIAIDRGFGLAEVAKMFGLDAPKLKRVVRGDGSREADYVAGLMPHQRILIVAGLLFLSDSFSGEGESKQARDAFFSALSVDADAITTKITVELGEKWAAEDAPKAKKGVKGPKPKKAAV